MIRKDIRLSFMNGFFFGIGFLLLLSLVGAVFAVGFHYASEILPGTFTGDFIFDGDVSISAGNDLCIAGGKCLSASLVSELDPTVPASIKNGVSWNEITNKPADFADGVDDVGSDSFYPRISSWEMDAICSPTGTKLETKTTQSSCEKLCLEYQYPCCYMKKTTITGWMEWDSDCYGSSGSRSVFTDGSHVYDGAAYIEYIAIGSK